MRLLGVMGPVPEPPPRVMRHEIEPMRRSLAMSDSHPRTETERLLTTCDELLAERARIERILTELQPAWDGARRAPDELHKILRPGNDVDQR